MTDGLYFDVIVFFLEQGVNENWTGTREIQKNP